MVELNRVLEKMRLWEADPEPPIADRKLVHKAQEGNVMVSRVERVDAENPDDFVAQLALDPRHPFFFEHPLDHFPGLMLIEAGRQLGTMVAHTFYGVEFDAIFVLEGVEVSFSTFAELDSPVFVNSEVRDKKLRRDKLIAMNYDGNFVQHGQAIGFMAGRWRILDRKVAARLRGRPMPERE
jgi:hypothetical protein